MSERPSLVRRLEAGILLPLAASLRALPPRAHVVFGHGLGLLAHRLDRRHRRIARDNVRLALGTDEREAARIAKAAFLHFGRMLAETLALESYLRPGRERLFSIAGLEHLRAAHARGRGVIVFSAHYGNWELIAQRQALAGIPMDFIARPLDNPFIERAFTRWREAAGNRVLGKHGALRGAMRSLRDGRSLAILIDQSVSGPPRLFLPFLGRRASATTTLGRLATRLGSAVVPAVSFPRPRGGYDIVYLPALQPPEALSGEERAEWLTVESTRVVEGWIRERPDCWLWLHERWKSKPRPGETILEVESSER